ncbi:MAG: hypothetical protein AUG54_00190 [Ktedonobacter sp. 13_1_20CM_4_53_7]|nr:MAG: hypothetical protein AUG54_00190 [Ktedonobacter sp. 13_1_20CM_4_53_7]
MEICEQAIQLFQPICLLMQEKQEWIGTPRQFKEIICLRFPDEFAAKITAGRQKDLDDCAILLPKTKIRTRKQAQQVLDENTRGEPHHHLLLVATSFVVTGSIKINTRCTNGFRKPSSRA